MLGGQICSNYFTMTRLPCSYDTAVSVPDIMTTAGVTDSFDFGDVRKRICNSNWCFNANQAKLIWENGSGNWI